MAFPVGFFAVRTVLWQLASPRPAGLAPACPLTASPVPAAASHVAMHLAVVLHGMESVAQLPTRSLLTPRRYPTLPREGHMGTSSP